MKLSSSAFENGGAIPSQYTCDGGDAIPSLSISDVHPGTKSLVLIVDDPDAPNGTWVHWVMWNISPLVTQISERNLPKGSIEGLTSFGRKGYGGPCPPSGTHRYFFKLYALDTVLNIPLTSEAEDLEEAMKGHIIGDAKIMGTYERK